MYFQIEKGAIELLLIEVPQNHHLQIQVLLMVLRIEPEADDGIHPLATQCLQFRVRALVYHRLPVVDAGNHLEALNFLDVDLNVGRWDAQGTAHSLAPDNLLVFEPQSERKLLHVLPERQFGREEGLGRIDFGQFGGLDFLLNQIFNKRGKGGVGPGLGLGL